jgi:class 3 adenylate cyclase/tetratricopeptide (TPR) repeat protein
VEPAAEVGRVVTLVTSDLKGSTALGERLDPEALREVLNRYFGVMRAVFESHGGTIEKIIGDAIVAVFGLPEPKDDDAICAVEAAAESQRALATLNDELDQGWGVRLVVRTGIASGEVTFGKADEGQHVLLGPTVDLSTVMEQNSPPLEVLMAESTRLLVGDAVEVEEMEPVSPKGSDEQLPAFRLVSVKEREGHTGGALAATEAASRDTRRTVTIVFALAKPHTMTGAEAGPDVMRDVMSEYFDAMRSALEHHGGTVEKFIGDAVMAVFGLPIRHEDDALRAVRAASDMQAAIGPLNDRFRGVNGVELVAHIGVNTGEVIASGDASSAQRLVTGDAVNTAARLEQAAGPGEIVLGDLTYRLSRDEVEIEVIPPLTLKGKAEPVPAYRLVSVGRRRTAQGAPATPFVGREAEIGRLSGLLFESIDSRRARLISVVGDAGVGKSRLIREFADSAAHQARVIRGRCLPYGNGITFWPLAEAVREVAAIASDDPPPVAIGKIRAIVADGGAGPDESAIVDRVAAAINLSEDQFPVGELLWGARRLLETMARRQPLAFIIDDIHSAEATFLDLLDHVVEVAEDAPILLLCSSRHELAERHPEWSEAHAGDTITLEPLTDTEAGQVVGELLGTLDESVRGRIASAAEGNPLYVEQIVSMLVETRAIERDGDRWVARAGADQLAIPPTVQALVAARLDALGDDERSVIEPASVIGLSFPQDALDELVDDPIRPLLGAELFSLTSKQLIRQAVAADVVYRFGHLVIRDTAYGGLLKRVRAALHERFVVWAERVNKERGRETEFEEILGYHLEQAFRYRTELGVIDATAWDVGERAAVKLASAGRRALGRGDLPAAVSLLRRAVAVLPRESHTRIELMVDLADGHLQQGEFEAAAAVLAEGAEIAAELGEARLAARVTLLRTSLDIFGPDEGGSAVEALEVANRALETLQRAGDDAGLARAWRLTMQVEAMLGHYEQAAAAAERVVEHANRAGDGRLASRSAPLISYTLVHGPTPVDEATASCTDLLEATSGDRKVEAVLLGGLAQLAAMRGEFDEGRAFYRRGQTILTELGAGIDGASTSIDSARVELLAGDLVAAEAELRRDYDTLAAVGETYFRSTIAGLLAIVLVDLDRTAEADGLARIAEEISGADDVLSQVLWRLARARIRAAAGEAAVAESLARAAVALADETGDIELRADALAGLGAVLRTLGAGNESGPPIEEALKLYERKGDVVSARAMREALGVTAA